MTRLALVAVLLMALAPSVSKVLASGTTQVLAGWAQLCTMQGLKWVDTAARSPAEKPPFPAGTPMGDNCAYCLLAASLPLVLLFLFVLFPRLTAGNAIPIGPPRRRTATNLRGLGGQGPPVLL